MKTKTLLSCLFGLILACLIVPAALAILGQAKPGLYADVHMHNSNFAAQGVPIRQFLPSYGKGRVVRSVLMPVPLQQKWDAFEGYASNRMPPNYYIGPKAELYYYGLADAIIARDYEKLPRRDRARLDPMITGFNPMDMYASEHVRRMLLAFPGVFSGIGEFIIHKEVASGKIAGQPTEAITAMPLPPDLRPGETMTLYNPSLVRLLRFTGETGLVALIHNDIYATDVSPDGESFKQHPETNYAHALVSLCQAAPEAKVIWAHTGLGRYVKATPDHLQRVAEVLDHCPNWSVDISWDAVQEQIVHGSGAMPTLQNWTAFLTKYQDRVLWGSDSVLWSRNEIDAEGNPHRGKRLPPAEYQATVHITDPLWRALEPGVAERIRMKNYRKLFDAARAKIRQWERRHREDDIWKLSDD